LGAKIIKKGLQYVGKQRGGVYRTTGSRLPSGGQSFGKRLRGGLMSPTFPVGKFNLKNINHKPSNSKPKENHLNSLLIILLIKNIRKT
jgi:hypothetical protein